MTKLNKILKSTVTVLLILCLAGCSSKFAYRYLDWLASISISDYVSFTRDQSIQANKKIDEVIAWHQSTQLIQYSDLLSELMADLQEPISADVLNRHMDLVYVLGRNLSTEVAPKAAVILASLSDSQVDDLLENIEEKTEERRREIFDVSPQEYREERSERLVELLEKWMGSLSKEQLAIIDDWSEQVSDPRDYWLEYKLIWNEEFEKAMRNRKSPEFPKQLELLFVNFDQLWPEKYTKAQENNVQQGIKMTVAMRAVSSEKQVRKFTKELDKLRLTFAELAAEAGSQDKKLALSN